tara:strand:+ start:318 stop:428 length:111 start_codon:yes stop_codon:yes gene_type:complete
MEFKLDLVHAGTQSDETREEKGWNIVLSIAEEVTSI